MDAVFKVPSSEFNEELFKKILALVKGTNSDITIAVKEKSNVLSPETNDQFFEKLNKSIEDIELGKGVTFTMEELNDFISK
ncbi:hypothetical protein BH11BAC3_BH11BAC3_06690 [soil metagenome]